VDEKAAEIGAKLAKSRFGLALSGAWKGIAGNTNNTRASMDHQQQRPNQG